MNQFRFSSDHFDFDRDDGVLGSSDTRLGTNSGRRIRYMTSGRRGGIPSYVIFIILVIVLIALSIAVRCLPQLG